MSKKPEDNRDVFDKIADYAVPAAGTVLGGVAGRKLFGKTASRKLRVKDVETGTTYSVETGKKSDFARGVISNRSPLARATTGRKSGEKVHVDTPGGGRTYEVIENVRGPGAVRNAASYAAGGSVGAAGGYESRRRK